MRALPPRYKIDIRIKEGMHQSENAGESDIWGRWLECLGCGA
jgi:hypothetical protein